MAGLSCPPSSKHISSDCCFVNYVLFFLPQIMSACKYVLSLGVTDPLMKVLAGLEMVLKKAQVCMINYIL